MFDPKRTVELITGGLTQPAATWERYLGQNPDWQTTAVQLTLPLVIIAVVIGWILAAIFGTMFYWGYGHGLLVSLVIGPLMALLSIAIVSLVISFMSGILDGQNDFNRGFAAASLVAIPAYAGSALASIPLVGWLLSIVGGIVSLVFLYRIIPMALGVPENRRVMHFILSILVIIVINLLIGVIVGLGTAGQVATTTPAG